MSTEDEDRSEMASHKFHPERAEVLNDPRRLEILRPELLWAAVERPAPRAVVDIGAGTGLVTSAFARLAPETLFYAADLSPEMLDYMTSHLPADVADRITPVQATETEVPLPDGLADVVTMIGLYHELEAPVVSLAEARRLSAPGGRLLVVDWKPGAAGFGPPEESRVAAEEIAERIRDAGFRDVERHDILEAFSVLTASR